MTIVVDTGVVVGLFLQVPGWRVSRERFRGWIAEGRPVHAPMLLLYEVTSVLRRALHMRRGGPMGEEEARRIVAQLFDLGIRFEAPTAELLGRSLVWARRLEQAQAYDAQFVALAEMLDAEFWTADGRLARRLPQVGFPNVRSVLATDR